MVEIRIENGIALAYLDGVKIPKQIKVTIHQHYKHQNLADVHLRLYAKLIDTKPQEEPSNG